MLRSVLPAHFDVLLSAVRQKGKRVSFRKRQVIFLAGSSCDSLYFIEEGLAKVSVNSPDGREAIVFIMGKGYFLGLDCLQDDTTNGRARSATALTNLRAWRIERRFMLELLRTVSQFSQMFVSHLVDLVNQLGERIAEGLLYGSEERLARTLLLMEQSRGHDAYHLPRGMSQTDMASMIGATRQRVNAVMQQLRKQGMIDSRGAALHDSIQQITSRARETNARRLDSPLRSRKPNIA